MLPISKFPTGVFRDTLFENSIVSSELSGNCFQQNPANAVSFCMKMLGKEPMVAHYIHSSWSLNINKRDTKTEPEAQ